MTGPTNSTGGKDAMNFDETMLKERCEAAVGGISPDVARLVGAGSDLGAGMRRRRRAQGLGAAVASAAAVAAIAYVGIGQGLFGPNATAPADGGPTSVEQLVPATPRGMAAAVKEHIDSDVLLASGGDSWDGSADTAKEINIDLGYHIDGESVELRVFASDDVSQWREGGDSCPREASVLWCDDAALPDGTPALQLLMKYPGPPRPDATGDDLPDAVQSDTDPSLSTYSAVSGVLRDGQLVAVFENLRIDYTGAGRYTVDDLPISMATLREIATDPAVGLSTTQQFNEEGKQIEDFDEGVPGTTRSGSSSTEVVEPDRAPPVSESLPNTEPPTTPSKRPQEAGSSSAR